MDQDLPAIYYSASASGFYVEGINSQIPADAQQITPDRWSELLIIQSKGGQITAGADGLPTAEIPVPGPVSIPDVQAAVQQRLDVFARTRNYDGILSACTYATSKNPQFKAEGQAAVDARDGAWETCYEILRAINSGERAMPANVEEILGELPAMVWPE